MAAPVPVVEIADHRNELGIGRPDREVDPARAFMLDRMRAKLVEQPEVRALVDEEIVERPQHRAERIGVRHPPFVRACGAAIRHRLAHAWNVAFGQSALIDALQFAQRLAPAANGLQPFPTRGSTARANAPPGPS
jgi:hypothetical protein